MSRLGLEQKADIIGEGQRSCRTVYICTFVEIKNTVPIMVKTRNKEGIILNSAVNSFGVSWSSFRAVEIAMEAVKT